MRKIISIVLIALFLVTFFKPILPYFEYIIRYDYISEILCINKEKPQSTCQGKCYLKKQISKSSNNKSSIPQYLKNKLLCFPVFIEKTTRLDFSLISQKISYTDLYLMFLSTGFKVKVFQPPQYS